MPVILPCPVRDHVFDTFFRNMIQRKVFMSTQPEILRNKTTTNKHILTKIGTLRTNNATASRT